MRFDCQSCMLRFHALSFAARFSRSYSSFGDVPVFRWSSVTAAANLPVAASYSIVKRVFSSQAILPIFHEALVTGTAWRQVAPVQ